MSVDLGFVKEIADLIDGDAWTLADRLVDRFPVETYGGLGDKKDAGLYAELEEYETALRIGYGIEKKARTLQSYRSTAVAWPNALRSALASFDAHRSVRGPNREREMKKLLRMAARENRALSGRMVGRFRVDEKGGQGALKPLDERVWKKLDTMVRGLLIGNRVIKRPEWWTSAHASEDSRRIVAQVLRSYANDIEPS